MKVFLYKVVCTTIQFVFVVVFVCVLKFFGSVDSKYNEAYYAIWLSCFSPIFHIIEFFGICIQNCLTLGLGIKTSSAIGASLLNQFLSTNKIIEN